MKESENPKVDLVVTSVACAIGPSVNPFITK